MWYNGQTDIYKHMHARYLYYNPELLHVVIGIAQSRIRSPKECTLRGKVPSVVRCVYKASCLIVYIMWTKRKNTPKDYFKSGSILRQDWRRENKKSWLPLQPTFCWLPLW